MGLARDTKAEESAFIRKLVRFRPDLWARVDHYQRREFIKKDTEAIFRLIEKGLEAEGVPTEIERAATD